MDQDDHIRVKDTMPLDETKFTLEIKPIHLLILQGNNDQAFRVIKDTINFARHYFRKNHGQFESE